MFDRDDSDESVWSSYVLDSVDRDSLEREISTLRKSLGSPVLDFTTLDWTTVRGYALRLPNDLAAFAFPSATTTSHASSTLVDAGAPRSSLVLASAIHSAGMAEYVKATKEIISSLDDSKINSAHEKLSTLVSTTNSQHRAIADYYASFLPPPATLKNQSKSAIRRIFEAILSFIKKIIESARSAVDQAWRVLRNPDELYLRLRGEVAELARTSDVGRVIDVLLLVPDLFRLFARLMFDERVSLATKGDVLLAIAYLIVPIDLLPESILGPIGYLDDAAILASQLAGFVDGRSIHPDLLREHWSGSEEQLMFVMNACQSFVDSVPFLASTKDWLTKRTT